MEEHLRQVSIYLTGERRWSGTWFSQGEVHPLYSKCVNPRDFPKFRKLNCIIGVVEVTSHHHLLASTMFVAQWEIRAQTSTRS